MISKENFHFYLRYLVKIADEHPMTYDEIPKEFQNFFTIPALSQALNISINKPKINWSKVEKYINANSFASLDSLVNGINDNFQSLSDKIYAAFYFIANKIDYDENRDSSISIGEVIKTKKALGNEFLTALFEIAKKIGFTSKTIQMVKFHNDSTHYKWDVFNPPTEPNYSSKSILLKIDDEFFISNPYFGAGYWKNKSFCKEYRKVFFLIPYYNFLVSYFPEDNSIVPSTYPYTWKNFSLLSRPNLEKELSFETNTYQIITVTDGSYDFQFSLIQPCPSFIVDLFRKEGDKFESQDSKYTSVTLLEKDIPNHCYSAFPDEKRCRYKISTVFPKEGDWLIKVFYNRSYFFEINFSVKKSSDALLDIPGYNKEEASFIPVTPLRGLTSVENGYARIRFVVKMKRSPLLIETYKIKPGTYEREDKDGSRKFTSVFTLDLPSDIKNESADPLEKLVEDWVLVRFPEDGRFEVYIYFKNDQGTYSYGVTYYFDVKGANSHKIEYSVFDVPKNRAFIQFKTKTSEKVWAEPSSSVELVDDLDFFFHVFSKDEIKVYFNPVSDENQKTVWPSLVQTNETNNQDIIDREYTVAFPSNGQYELNFWYGNDYLGYQTYIVSDVFQYPEETEADKSLLKKLKNNIEGVIEYNDDIPIKIQKDVDLMIVDAEGQRDERLQLEAKEREKKEKERKERKEKILREREKEDQLEREKEEKEKKEKEEKKKKEMEEIKKFEKEVAEKESKMKKKRKNNKSENSGSKEIDFLKQKTSALEKEKEAFKLRFEEMERKEEKMRKEFQNEIERMKKDWNRKEEEEERARKQRNQKIEQEEEEEEKRARKESEERINELRQRIKAIEIQLKFDPNKRNELANLHEKLKSEEENDVIINSARTQKRIDRARQEERENEERRTNQEYSQRKYIAEKENEFIKSVRDEEDKFRKERAKLREQMNKNKKKITLDEFEEDESDDEFEDFESEDDKNQNNNNEDEFEDFESEDDKNQNNNNENEFEFEEEEEVPDDDQKDEFEIDDDSDDEEPEASNIQISKAEDNVNNTMKTASSNVNDVSTKSENPTDKPSGGKSSCCLLI